MEEVETACYLRLRALDRPGVLADVTRICADLSISIDAIFQKEAGEGEEQVDVVILTHVTPREAHQRGHPAHRGAADDSGAGGAHPAGGAALSSCPKRAHSPLR